MHLLYSLPKQDIKLKYFLAFLLIALSGINFFLGDHYLLVSFLLITSIFFIKKNKIDNFTFHFISLFLLIFIIQSINSKVLPYHTQIGFIVRILFAYFCIKLIGREFPKYYINLIIIFSIISFIFFVPILISPSFERLLIDKVAPVFNYYDYDTSLYKNAPQFIIFTINTARESSILPRNSGPFWEPGAFAGFLIIAIIFNIIISKSLLRDIRSIVLIIALLSTFSTAGYIAAGILIIAFVWLYKDLRRKIIWLPISIIILYLSFTYLDFLDKKIEKDIKYSMNGVTSSLDRTRFVSGMLDLKELSKNPLIGVGLVEPDYSYGLKKQINHRNNGDTVFAKKFGLVIFFIFFFSMYRSFVTMCFVYKIKISFAVIVMITIFTIGFSQTYFTLPFFISLVFINFLYFNRFPKIKRIWGISFLKKLQIYK